MRTTEQSLPEEFEDLNSFVSGWALATESERNKKRLSATMSEIQGFYNAILPRMEEIILYLNQYPLNEMPEQATRLLYLALSFMEISTAVELFNEPDESGVFPAARLRIVNHVR